MAFLKIAVFAALAVTAMASPVYESQSYSQSSSGQEISQAPSYSQAPLVTYSHEPLVTYSQAPVAVHAPLEVEHYAPAQYEFKYGVKDDHTHDIKEQAEKRVGDKVEGYYKLVEPDGTTRTVHYTSDKHTGFNAVVTKSGHASHPATPIKVAAPVLSYSHGAPLLSYSSGLGSYH